MAIGERGRVIAMNALASEAEVALGMPRRSAEALCPTAITVVQDLTAETVRFEPVVEKVEQLIPSVEVVSPGLLFVPIGGAIGYYGGEEALIERLDKELLDIAEGHRVGIAAGLFAAEQAARMTSSSEPINLVEDDEAFRANLDIASIGSDNLAETFRWLGITTLGALAGLPRDALVSRFGSGGVEAHRLASGSGRGVDPRDVPTDSAVSMDFEPPIEALDQAAFVARTIAQRLIAGLAEQGIAPHRVTVTAKALDGTERTRVWRSADPFSDHSLAERIRWQLRAWIDGVGAGIRGGLVGLVLEPSDISGSGRQMALTEDARTVEEAQRALMEVQAIAGADNLLVSEPQGGRDPAHQVLWTRWGDEAGAPHRSPDAPWPGQVPGPSPALVPPKAVPFEVSFVDGIPEQVRLRSRWVPVLSWAGPWRSVGRWWDGEGSADRYQVVTSTGAYLCEVRDGKSYLLGVYD